MEMGPLTLVLLLACLGLQSTLAITHGVKCFVPGQCLDSLILDVNKTETARDCLHHCQQRVDGCEWFTYYKNTKSCFSLSVCLEFDDKGCKDCVSGEEECQEFQCGLTGRCLGALEGVRIVDNHHLCMKNCTGTKNCEWYSYDHGSKTCVLTADCPVVDSSCKSCRASEIGCGKEAGKSQSSSAAPGAAPTAAPSAAPATTPSPKPSGCKMERCLYSGSAERAGNTGDPAKCQAECKRRTGHFSWRYPYTCYCMKQISRKHPRTGDRYFCGKTNC